MKRYIQILAAVCSIAFSFAANAQERVYVSTDKDCYLAGEDIWISAFCMDENKGVLGGISKVAYIEFHTNEGVATTVKIGLKGGRGCGKLQIPFSFPTGNYSIVAYTKLHGGNSTGAFNGKIITIFNTLSSSRVEGGVEVVKSGDPVRGSGVPHSGSNAISLDVQQENGDGDAFPVVIRNLSGNALSVGVSVYHLDEVNALVGEWGYNGTSLLERRGDFERTGKVDYAGEVIRARVTPKGGDAASMRDKMIYMSAMGNTDDIFVNSADEKGEVVYYTNNIYDARDLVFEVVGDTSKAYDVEILKDTYIHKAAEIPVLRISPKMQDALLQRGLDMQIVKRFEADTIFNLMDRRANSFIGTVQPQVYNLDDYTRFPVMEEVIREYVKDLRVRREGGETVLRIMWESREKALVLLDGVPVLDHSQVVKLDPMLVKQIVVYPRRYILNNLIYDGIVKFNTYKDDMAGLKMGKNVTVESHKGVQYPLAFLGSGIRGSSNYPNFNGTIYWNPLVEVDADGTFEFECVKPQYKGKFKIVVEGVDARGKEIYTSTTFTID